MAIDNEPTSPFYGRIYIVWTDFGSGSRIHSIFSTDAGATWSAQLAISRVGREQPGRMADDCAEWRRLCHLAEVACRRTAIPNGNIEIPIMRSTNGGVSYTTLTPATTNKIEPGRESAVPTAAIVLRSRATFACCHLRRSFSATAICIRYTATIRMASIPATSSTCSIAATTPTTCTWDRKSGSTTMRPDRPVPAVDLGRIGWSGHGRLLQPSTRSQQSPDRLLLAYVVRQRRQLGPNRAYACPMHPRDRAR